LTTGVLSIIFVRPERLKRPHLLANGENIMITYYDGTINVIKRCHFSFPVFLKKPVSTHIFWNIYRYTAYIILFGFSSSSWSLLYRFWWI